MPGVLAGTTMNVVAETEASGSCHSRPSHERSRSRVCGLFVDR